MEYVSEVEQMFEAEETPNVWDRAKVDEIFEEEEAEDSVRESVNWEDV